MTAPAADGSAPAPDDLAELAVELARGAAALVRERRDAADPTITSKSTSTDLVTDIDRASERWLVEALAERRPHDAVLGEEGGGRPGTSGVRWVLDPIDGTVNFVLGVPAFAVSVAAEVAGRVVAGAVCNPVSSELFSASLGGGAYLDGTRLHGTRGVPLERAVIGTGFAYDRDRRARQAAVVAQVLPHIADVRRIGAAALDLCSVAAGRLDGYFEAGLQPWDLAAGGLVAAEAGCRVTGLRGAPASSTMVVAAGPSVADDLVALLERLGADQFD